MLTTFKATAKKTATGLQVETDARGFKFVLDEPADLGGTDTVVVYQAGVGGLLGDLASGAERYFAALVEYFR